MERRNPGSLPSLHRNVEADIHERRRDLTRRGLLWGTAATAAVGVAPAQPAPAPQPDAELALPARRFTEACGAYDAAERHYDVCDQRFLDEGSDPPEALTCAGPLGKLLHKWDWWSENKLHWLLTDRGRRKHWRSARKLLPVARAYEARKKRFSRKCGLPAAERAQRAAHDAVAALGDAILTLPARSPAALALKARAVKSWGKPEWWEMNADDADTYERLAAQILDAVMTTAAAEPQGGNCAAQSANATLRPL